MHTYLNIGQCAALSQWNPLFFLPVQTSQMIIAWGSSLISISGLNVTRYLTNIPEAEQKSISSPIRCPLPTWSVSLVYYPAPRRSTPRTMDLDHSWRIVSTDWRARSQKEAVPVWEAYLPWKRTAPCGCTFAFTAFTHRFTTRMARIRLV